MGLRDLPLAAGSAHVAALERCGWRCTRRSAKNHYILEREGVEEILSIPDHKEVKRQLLQAQIRLAGISESEYLAAFYKRRR